jgi:hypothetical protein
MTQKLRKLERIQKLKDKGVLTEKEFTDLKEEILTDRVLKVGETLGIWALILALIGIFYPEPWFDVAISALALIVGVMGIYSPRERFRGLAIPATILGFLGIIAGIYVSLGFTT